MSSSALVLKNPVVFRIQIDAPPPSPVEKALDDLVDAAAFSLSKIAPYRFSHALRTRFRGEAKLSFIWMLFTSALFITAIAPCPFTARLLIGGALVVSATKILTPYLNQHLRQWSFLNRQEKTNSLLLHTWCLLVMPLLLHVAYPVTLPTLATWTFTHTQTAFYSANYFFLQALFFNVVSFHTKETGFNARLKHNITVLQKERDDLKDFIKQFEYFLRNDAVLKPLFSGLEADYARIRVPNLNTHFEKKDKGSYLEEESLLSECYIAQRKVIDLMKIIERKSNLVEAIHHVIRQQTKRTPLLSSKLLKINELLKRDYVFSGGTW